MAVSQKIFYLWSIVKPLLLAVIILYLKLRRQNIEWFQKIPELAFEIPVLLIVGLYQLSLLLENYEISKNNYWKISSKMQFFLKILFQVNSQFLQNNNFQNFYVSYLDSLIGNEGSMIFGYSWIIYQNIIIAILSFIFLLLSFSLVDSLIIGTILSLRGVILLYRPHFEGKIDRYIALSRKIKNEQDQQLRKMSILKPKEKIMIDCGLFLEHYEEENNKMDKIMNNNSRKTIFMLLIWIASSFLDISLIIFYYQRILHDISLVVFSLFLIYILDQSLNKVIETVQSLKKSRMEKINKQKFDKLKEFMVQSNKISIKSFNNISKGDLYQQNGSNPNNHKQNLIQLKLCSLQNAENHMEYADVANPLLISCKSVTFGLLKLEFIEKYL